MSFEGLLSVSTNSSALCHESFSRASDPSFSSCFLPACFVCPHKDYRSTSKDVSSVFDRWLWYVAIKGVRTCRTRQGPSVHWVSHHGFSSFPRVHVRSMHDPTLTRLSSTLQRVGLAVGSTCMSNGRGRVACVRFCTLPTHGEPAWGRHLSTGVAEGVDASGRDDPSWRFLNRPIVHGTDLGRGFFRFQFFVVIGNRDHPCCYHDPKTETGVGRHPHGAVGWEEPMPRPRKRQGKGQRMRCPSLTPKHRSVAPEWGAPFQHHHHRRTILVKRKKKKRPRGLLDPADPRCLSRHWSHPRRSHPPPTCVHENNNVASARMGEQEGTHRENTERRYGVQ